VRTKVGFWEINAAVSNSVLIFDVEIEVSDVGFVFMVKAGARVRRRQIRAARSCCWKQPWMIQCRPFVKPLSADCQAWGSSAPPDQWENCRD